MAHEHGAYAVAPWVLYQSADPLRAAHGQAGVDAVIVETPFERVRYEAFLDAIQGLTVTPGMVSSMARQARSSIGFLVYAHSRTDEDHNFLQGFSPGVLILSTGARVPDDQIVRFGPSSDFYDVGTFREQRWVGSITYRFPLRSCDERGRFDFSDPYGHRYDLPFDLSRFR
ncbi:MAG TPA: hypothetical protein VFE17_02440 [Candidatus Baltobacteraceae bacterium]|jgi:hypothetical protein|nr:hypothetical protein [Candidatus Baltobacteraceae bacterium]